MKVDVHIERLIMDDLGQGPLQRDRLQAAVRAEIERQLRLNGAGWPGQAQPPPRSVDGGQIAFGGSAGPGTDRVGRQIGRAVYRSVYT